MMAGLTFDVFEPSDPVVRSFAWPKEPEAELVYVNVSGATDTVLVSYYEKLIDLIDWFDMRTTIAGAARAEAEDAYDDAVAAHMSQIPNSEGSERKRLAIAESRSMEFKKSVIQARSRHDICKARLRALERRVKLVEEAIWACRAKMKAGVL
jgi:hypothetical protein